MAGGKMLSEEYVQDSSDEETSTSSHELESASITGKSKTNRVATENQSDAESSEDSDSDDEHTTAQRNVRRTSGAEPDTSSQGQKRMRSAQQSTVLPSTKKPKTSQDHPLRIASTAFKAPSGYLPISLKASEDTSEQSGMFNNLDGKQIWHITAPAALPVSSIKSFNIQSALEGGPVLEHNGIEYHMRRDQVSNEAVLTPSNKDNSYSTCSKTISRNFCLVESHSSNLETQSSAADGQEETLFVAHEVGAKPLPRKQPTGLLKRYQPYGAVVTGSEQLMSPETKEGEILDRGLVMNQTNGIMPNTSKVRVRKSKNREEVGHVTMDAEAVSSPAKNSEETRLSGSSAAKDPSKQKSEKKKKKHKEKTGV